ncbi:MULTISPECIES: hypothetical protein [Pseudoalteromonas]|uniref:Uncharacterized protein n=1 Tax=Pseudoalteromonas luteoviolacea (strain 2ta16) TaxID=1353533 RepID=V4HSB8_PSEL2|nr:MULTISPECIES: hypothetical protein [Pseudoalteromonas]ESP90799.1 hypothetical protein PL2TA16_01903 [Pseudoalteromonas luteoviolacea 2ta16]KZN41626.1 hypothetical protein N483_13230 [Pseudoalteromonas luteoviolacea NCIMB 1944]MCG7548209.1 hypothetical protein [Pseudoalteromonas sp. Of7M-16]
MKLASLISMVAIICAASFNTQANDIDIKSATSNTHYLIECFPRYSPTPYWSTVEWQESQIRAVLYECRSEGGFPKITELF